MTIVGWERRSMSGRAAPRAVNAARLAVALCLVASVASACQASPGPVLPASASVAPPPAAPSVTVSAAPSASATTGPDAQVAIRVLEGLRSFATAPSTTYRVTFTGDSRHSADVLAVKGSMDAAGDDVSLTASFRFPTGTSVVTYLRVGGRDWGRVGKGPWGQPTGIPAAAVVDPFAGARVPGGLQYLGPVKGQQDRYQVALAATYLHPILIPASNLTAEKVTKTSLLLVTDGTGRPVRGTWRLDGQGRVSGQLQEIVMNLELTWSRIGERVRISAP